MALQGQRSLALSRIWVVLFCPFNLQGKNTKKTSYVILLNSTQKALQHSLACFKVCPRMTIILKREKRTVLSQNSKGLALPLEREKFKKGPRRIWFQYILTLPEQIFCLIKYFMRLQYIYSQQVNALFILEQNLNKVVNYGHNLS